MRALFAIATLWAGIARADVPAALSTEHVDLLDGRIAVALVEGSAVDGPEAAHADWGDVRITVIARDLGTVRLADVRDRIAREVRAEGQIVTRIEPIALARPNLGYGASVRTPRAVDGRELVYAAFVVDRDRGFYELAFSVDTNDTPDAWSHVAARIAATIIVRTPHARPTPRPRGTCAVLADLVFAPYPIDTVQVFPAVRGTLYGRAAVWSVWLDGNGYHAEAMAQDAHVVCSAATRDALERSRRAISY